MTTEPKEGVPVVQATAPARIWLAVADEPYYRDQPFPSDYGEDLCWSTDAPLAVCVPYVRADLHPTPSAVEALARAAKLCKAEFAHCQETSEWRWTELLAADNALDAALAHPEIAALLGETK